MAFMQALSPSDTLVKLKTLLPCFSGSHQSMLSL